MYGIPNMKLEKTVIERRAEILKEEGIIFKTCVNVGVDVKYSELDKEYDAVVVTIGASNPRDLKAPGRELNGIHFAVKYLATVRISTFPVRSPFPNRVPSTRSAPASMASSVEATPSPRSL